MPQLKALLIDLSGTLHVGNEATPNALEALRRLRAAKVPLRFCSNTTKDGSKALLGRLTKIGFDIAEHEVFTSLSAVKLLVEQRNLRPMLLLSESALQDFSHIPTDSPNAVVVGLAQEKLNYENLNAAFRLLSGEDGNLEGGKKPVLIATHRAMYFKDEDKKLSLGPGGFISALEQACNVQAEVVGKPTRSFFEVCLRSLESEGISEANWSEVGMVGDDYRNDLGEGAKELNLQRYLVRTGKYRQGDEEAIEGGKERCYATFADVVEAVLAE